MDRKVTMRDVARAVNLSPMTVSRALRDDQTVSTRTRKLIRKAARELGYVYDGTAHAFRKQKSGFVAVILPSVNNANFADTFDGLTAGLEGQAIQLLLGSTNYQVEKEFELVQQLLARKPEAVVLTGGYHLPETRTLLAAARVPVIETWDLPIDPLGHVVGFSNTDAMEPIVAHLAAVGRRNLAFVGASPSSDMRGAARRDGVVAAARALGLPDVAIIDAGPAPVSMKQGVTALEQLGRKVSRYDALVCVSDPVAFGVLNACRRLGLKVPDDIAITGFGNFDVANVSNPQITTVDVHANKIGREVVDVLQGIFERKPDVRRIDVGFDLILGETS